MSAPKVICARNKVIVLRIMKHEPIRDSIQKQKSSIYFKTFSIPFYRPKKFTGRIICQQDGAPNHFTETLHSWLYGQVQ